MDGRAEGVTAVSEALVSVADRDRAQQPEPVGESRRAGRAPLWCAAV
ncbi:hypothetical protein SXIM_54730 [Streptomyces xiamenensis]|uniref:Uncharacterized protein n=1 Tax=Streptomyces xiamenensis TaxID=408015 RepID=A0A0F7G2K1_9ACTN|nr:hypothetical protein SXIM_54730 [Streptomyces xiamenensis]